MSERTEPKEPSHDVYMRRAQFAGKVLGAQIRGDNDQLVACAIEAFGDPDKMLTLASVINATPLLNPTEPTS